MPREVNRPSDRDDPRDCNPMFNRLPAEVTSRRKHVVVTEDTGDGPVTLDRKVVFTLKADKRQKWLVRALKQLGDSQVRPNDLYDLIASTRFGDDLPYKVGVKMNRSVQEKLSLFSAKQQLFLCSQAGLHVKFGQKVFAKDPEEKVAEAEAPVNGKQPAANMEDMMARCRAFVRTKANEQGAGLAAGGDNGGEKADEAEVEWASDGAAFDPKAMEAMEKSIQAAKEAKRAKSSRGRSKAKKSGKTKKAKSSSSSSSSKAKRRKKEKARAKSSSSSSSSKAKRRKKDKARAKSNSSSSSSKAKRRKKEKARATSKSPSAATGPSGKQEKDDKPSGKPEKDDKSRRRRSKSSDSSKSARKKKASKSESKKQQKKRKSSSSSNSSESPSKSRKKDKEKEKEKEKDTSKDKDKEKSSKEKKSKS